MNHPATWNPLTEWKPTQIKWVKVDITPEDMKRFTTRSNLKGLIQAVGFLLAVAVTGTFAYWAFSQQYWLLLALALYIHGAVFTHFGEGIHELIHNTVFASHWLNTFFTTLYGLVHWAQNPYLYRLSHMDYHHRYTLHQGSDGEDVPNYVEINARLIFDLFFRIVQVKTFILCLARLFTFIPTSRGWRGRSYRLDTWEQFILNNASDKHRRQVYRLGVYALVAQALFVSVCLYFGLWFLPALVTLAPFYGPAFHTYICGVHQHSACEANHPDFRISCGDAILDPLSSFLYWHMEYHIEHHMFAAIPCYNLKKFSRFVADQLPAKEYSLPRILKLHNVCKEKYQSWQNWRDNFGRYKGF